MTLYLTLAVHSHDGRYHGAGDDPPAPFRLFQALVAGAGLRGPIDGDTAALLTWLEAQEAPIVASPRSVAGQVVAMFLPTNDLDAEGGDPRRGAHIRIAKKEVRPRLFDPQIPRLYCWPIASSDVRQAEAVCMLAEQLYQLGRGVDMAWASAELIEREELEHRLAAYNGEVLRPSNAGAGRLLKCPEAGSFESLEKRYYATRFRYEQDGKSVRRIFVKPPEPRFRHVAYECPPSRFLFELRGVGARSSWPLTAASALVGAARDSALTKIAHAMPDRVAELERYFVGRKADGSNSAPIEARVRIIPIPSIGTRFADRGIRRLLVEVPSACPVRAVDVRWAFSGAEIVDAGTGEVAILAPCDDASMLRHYAVDEASRVFRTVTPIVIPGRTIDRRPGHEGTDRRRCKNAELGSAKRQELSTAAGAIAEAMRHAGLRSRIESIRLQREPFEAAGERAESFAQNTRFASTRLWHVELVLERAVHGPLLLGDGRFLGLGIMAPVQHCVPGVHEFEIVEGFSESSAAADVTRALRRAVMARVQAEIGAGRELGTFFTGHARGGGPARGERDAHLGFAFDPTTRRVFIISPHLLERRTESRADAENLRVLGHALEGFNELVAGRAGRLVLRRTHSELNEHTLLAHGSSWMNVTPYVVTRHARGDSAAAAVATDVRSECRRLGLPAPIVDVQKAWGEPGRGLASYMRLTFPVGVSGPLVLGRERYFGGGLFRRCDAEREVMTLEAPGGVC